MMMVKLKLTVMTMTMTMTRTMTMTMTTLSYLKGKGKASFPAHKEGKVGQGLKSRHFPNDDHDDLIDANDDDYDDTTIIQVRNDYLKKNFESLDLDTAIQLCCIEIRRFEIKKPSVFSPEI